MASGSSNIRLSDGPVTQDAGSACPAMGSGWQPKAINREPDQVAQLSTGPLCKSTRSIVKFMAAKILTNKSLSVSEGSVAQTTTRACCIGVTETLLGPTEWLTNWRVSVPKTHSSQTGSAKVRCQSREMRGLESKA